MHGSFDICLIHFSTFLKLLQQNVHIDFRDKTFLISLMFSLHIYYEAVVN